MVSLGGRQAAEGAVTLTGNPFVDTGLAVISSMADNGRGLNDIEELTIEHVSQVYGDGTALARANSRLKSFTMLFTSNSLLTQPSIKRREVRETMYRAVLSGLLAHVGSDNHTVLARCQACGAERSLDFKSVCRESLKGLESLKSEAKVVGRDWFPLAGSLGSDAQALPGASRAVHLCAKCLFAVHYLPLGVFLLDGRLAVLQCTASDFWYDLLRGISREILRRVRAGIDDTLWAKGGSSRFVSQLLSLFRELKSAHAAYDLRPGTTLQVWRFTNSGASAECEIEEVPSTALVFLQEAASLGLEHEIEKLLEQDRKRERSFFRCIAEQRDYAGLYPQGRWAGASPVLYALYQTRICGRSASEIRIARRLASHLGRSLGGKEFADLQRREAFREGLRHRNRIRRTMADMTRCGEFCLGDYLSLFPPVDSDSGLTAAWGGWDVLSYYVHHASDASPIPGVADNIHPERAEKEQIVRYYANTIFDYLMAEHGRARFESQVIGRLARNAIGSTWLRRLFVILAEEHAHFSYGHWRRLCCLDDGRTSTGELLFQMRLLWIEWLKTGWTTSLPAPPLTWVATSGLSRDVEGQLYEVVTDYVRQRGLSRFRRDVLMPMRKGDMGIGWFRTQLVREEEDDSGENEGWTEEQWVDFLRDDEGMSMTSERLFQLHLCIAELYRRQRDEATSRHE